MVRFQVGTALVVTGHTVFQTMEDSYVRTCKYEVFASSRYSKATTLRRAFTAAAEEEERRVLARGHGRGEGLDSSMPLARRGQNLCVAQGGGHPNPL